MKLSIIKKQSKTMDDFLDREWKIANIKRFGKDVWVEKEASIIAEDQGEIIGYLHYIYRSGVMEIAAIIVKHNSQNNGIGTALMKQAESIALAEGAHKLYVITSFGERAIKFYESLGFKKTGILRNHYRNVDMTELSKMLENN